MNDLVKKALIIISVCFNIIFLLFIIFSLTRKSATISFLNLESDSDKYTTGVCIVSVPTQGADLVLGTPEFSLNVGEEAALQFSLFLERHQMNLALEQLYDHEIVSIDRSGYGLIITAIKPGETILQTMTGNGIRDIAIVSVTPASFE
jgi:hypothetical protein